MFKSSSPSTPMSKTTEINSPDRLNRLVEGTEIIGDIKADSNIRIDGKLKGTITTKGRLVIGPTGSIEGEIVCENADIEGSFVGKIVVNQLLSLKATAKFIGDIQTSKLAIEPGATFSGNCSMGGLMKDLKPSDLNKQNALAAEKTA
jgi:cytoskeletal protein CcmA (bactofilin family)